MPVPPIDFPPNPTLGQRYTAPSGAVYSWNGEAWTIGYYDSATQHLYSVGDVYDQIRSLLQDTDNLSGEYRYSADSILLCLNQGLIDLYRMRPDIFMANGFNIPQYNTDQLDYLFPIELQYVSPLVFYAVGLVQARDDEQTQDSRAAAFLQTFKGAVTTVS